MAASKRVDALRFRAFERDNYKCQCCGSRGSIGELEAHHITPLSEGGEDTLENLTTLCQPCHFREHVFVDSQFSRATTEVLEEFPVVTSRDLADLVGCSTETSRQWLLGMWEEGKLERRKVGGGALVYYPPYRTQDDARDR